MSALLNQPPFDASEHRGSCQPQDQGRLNQTVTNTRFYEDSFVKPLLIAAFVGGTS
jgi:hypothetical protein